MSVVTNLILTCFLLEEPGDEHYSSRTGALLALDLGQGQRFVDITESHHSRNSNGLECWHKALEHNIFVAAVNYLDDRKLYEALCAIQWQDARPSVRLMICGHDDDAFSMYTLDDLTAFLSDTVGLNGNDVNP